MTVGMGKSRRAKGPSVTSATAVSSSTSVNEDVIQNPPNGTSGVSAKKAKVVTKTRPKVNKMKELKKKHTNVKATKVSVDSSEVVLEPTRLSDEPVKVHGGRWTNKQRVLIFATRGITHRDRHLLLNLHAMMPHSKREPKMDKKDPTQVINEICQTRNCNKSIFLENKKRKDLYMWMSNVPHGPSAKFLVENVHTMEELRLTGNCLKGSRPMLSFDPQFDKFPHLRLLKEVFTQIFGIPNMHPKSQPFVDHILTFTWLDNRIWFRNYQILDQEGGSLAEVGPRLVLQPIKIFEGSYAGSVLWSNPHFVPPAKFRVGVREAANDKYKDRVLAKAARELHKPPDDQVYADMHADLDHLFESGKSRVPSNKKSTNNSTKQQQPREPSRQENGEIPNNDSQPEDDHQDTDDDDNDDDSEEGDSDQFVDSDIEDEEEEDDEME